MGKGQSRSARGRDQDDSSRQHQLPEAGRETGQVTGLAARLLAVMALLGSGTLAVPRACAQDTPPPKVEAPKPAPPAAPDVPKDSSPPPPDIQTKDSPTEKQKAAPSALDDTPKAAAPAPAEGEQAKALDAAQALSSKFKFSERYSTADTDDPAHPELITQYRVGVRETTKMVGERVQGAPEKSERNRVCLYTERAAKVGQHGLPTDLLRRYDKVLLKEAVPSRPLNPPFLEGLLIWYHRRPPLRPQVLSLTDRVLREDEFSLITEEVSIPQLIAFFPPAPLRVKETWSITRQTIAQFLGEMPDPDEFEMTGTLLKVSKANEGKSLVAELGISGQFNAPMAGLSSFNARIDFIFEPRGLALPSPGAEAPPRADGGRPRAPGQEGVVEATGRITQALLSHAAARPVPGSGGRLKIIITTELVLERRWGERAGPTAKLTLPEAPPTPAEANSWLVYKDPEGRFQFRHPQEFRPAPGPRDRDKIHLFDIRPTGEAALFLSFPSRDPDSAPDPAFLDPDHFKSKLSAQWTEDKFDVTHGPEEWLDDEDLKQLKRKVYRIEAAFKRPGTDKTIYADYYFVDLSRGQSILVESFTTRPDHLVCRKQAEDAIKSFELLSSGRRPNAPAAATPAATSPAIEPAPATPATTREATPEVPAPAPNSRPQ